MALSGHRAPAAPGAEIRDVDLSRAIDDEAFRAIAAAWTEHEVIFFRGPTLTGGAVLAA